MCVCVVERKQDFCENGSGDEEENKDGRLRMGEGKRRENRKTGGGNNDNNKKRAVFGW